ncbi:MAG: hypothetical protein GX977_13250 [Firmicutes bacterium]|nr:hypothetical protein [Bacillota bacterium]
MGVGLFGALAEVFTTNLFLYSWLGVLAGMIIGVLPGLSATMGVAILTPLTFWLQPAQGLAVLLGVYNSAIWAGGVSAVLINTPGTPASIAQTFDGYQMVKDGKIGLALNVNTIYSVIGGLMGTLALTVAAFPVARFALRFGPPEMFALAAFGLTMMISVSGKKIVNGLFAGALGLLVSTIGLDPMHAIPRFTFGNVNLLSGIPFVVALVGMFGVGEVLYQISERVVQKNGTGEEKLSSELLARMGRLLPTREELKESSLAVSISSVISVIIGAIPGTGGDIASIVCWQQAKQMSKNPDEFGEGSYTGLAVTSAANNAVIGGAMTTMMTLGIPGDGVTAVLIGSLMMYGMQPGPRLFIEQTDFVYSVMALMWVGYLMILALGMLSARASSVILRIKQEYIWIVIVGFCILGSFAINNSLFDVCVMFVAGILGFVFKKADIPLGPFILALLLGPIAESNFRRSLALSQGDLSIFVTRSITVVLLLLSVVSLLWAPISEAMRRKKTDSSQADA